MHWQGHVEGEPAGWDAPLTAAKLFQGPIMYLSGPATQHIVPDTAGLWANAVLYLVFSMQL